MEKSVTFYVFVLDIYKYDACNLFPINFRQWQKLGKLDCTPEPFLNNIYR